MKKRWLLLGVLVLALGAYYLACITDNNDAVLQVQQASSLIGPEEAWIVDVSEITTRLPATSPATGFAQDLEAIDLFIAMEAGDWATILAYLKAGGNPDVRDDKGRTLLMWAAMSAKPEVIEALIESGASLNLQDENGRNALMVATAQRHPEVVARLLSAGASVHDENHIGANLIHMAVEASDPELLSTFASAGVDLKKRFGDNEMDAYMLATVNGDLKMMEALHGLFPGFIHSLDREGRSVAHYSCGEGDLEATAAALRHGARMDVPDRYGRTAFDYAAELGNSACVSFIEEAGLGDYL